MKQVQTGHLDGVTPGWAIAGGRDGFDLEFGITADDQLTVSTPMRRQDAIDLAAMLTEAVRMLDEGEEIAPFVQE